MDNSFYRKEIAAFKGLFSAILLQAIEDKDEEFLKSNYAKDLLNIILHL